jgi:hypothetical protein
LPYKYCFLFLPFEFLFCSQNLHFWISSVLWIYFCFKLNSLLWYKNVVSTLKFTLWICSFNRTFLFPRIMFLTVGLLMCFISLCFMWNHQHCYKCLGLANFCDMHLVICLLQVQQLPTPFTNRSNWPILITILFMISIILQNLKQVFLSKAKSHNNYPTYNCSLNKN